MRYLLRLDLDLIQRNLAGAAGGPRTHEDVLRLLAGLGAWRQSDDWWGADERALHNFREGEILERRPMPPALGGVPGPRGGECAR